MKLKDYIEYYTPISYDRKKILTLKELALKQKFNKPAPSKKDFYDIYESDQNGKLYIYKITPKGRRKVFNKNGYIIDKRISEIRNLDKAKRVNKKALLKYFIEKSGEDYTPTKEEDFRKQLKEIKREETTEQRIYSKSRTKLEFSPKKKKYGNYNYMYIVVEVLIYLDGATTYSYGRSDYFYKKAWVNEKGRVYKAYDSGIPRGQLDSAIEQACRRAIAQYGSNVKYKIISWKYAYHYNSIDTTENV